MNSRLPDLCQIARDAGAAIMRVYDSCTLTPVAHTTKSDSSPLTEADLLSHQHIVSALSALTPDIPAVSEEGMPPAFDPACPRFWLVDPLDGTKEFLARTGEFTVNIALVEHGRPVLGVVYLPATDTLYWGGREAGAWRQTPERTERLASRSARNTDAPVRVLASRSHMDDATRDFIGHLGSVTLVQAGSSLKFCRVAEGAADIYPRFGPTMAWDTAAAQAVLEGAGGTVLTLEGCPLTCDTSGWRNPPFIAAARDVRY